MLAHDCTHATLPLTHTYTFGHWLAHSLACSLDRSLNHSLTHSLTDALTDPIINAHTHTLNESGIHYAIRSHMRVHRHAMHVCNAL